MNRALIISITTVLICFTNTAKASDKGFAILEAKCSSCHTIKGSSAATVDEMLNRKAPDLIDSGFKFKEGWLAKWLENPKRIRPAGYIYFNHIEEGTKEDVVKESSLKPHMKLSKEDAAEAAKALMTLKTNEVAMTKDVPDGPASFMGEMYFDKLSGCLACHQIEPGYGGYSGPELYTAKDRLTRDFVFSFIKNPELFNPKSIMPNKELSEKALQEVTAFIMTLETEGE